MATSALRVERYWQLPERTAEDGSPADIEGLTSELEGILESAVRRQLVSDVPLGILLSGGIDSSFVAAIAARSSSNIKAFTITFPGTPKIEVAREI